jgi:hypothetical protein
MILGFGENLLEKGGLDTEAQLFFVLRWEELFNEYTYDSWQVRTSNLRTILSEMLEVLDMSATSPSSYSALVALSEEMLEIAKKDIVIREDFSKLLYFLEQTSELIEKNRNDKTRDIDSVRRQIRLVQTFLCGYREKLLERLNKLLLAPVGSLGRNYKIELYGLSMSLAIELASNEFSTAYLRDSWQILIQPVSDRFPVRLERFFNSFNREPRSFKVYFPIRTKRINRPEQFSNIKIVSSKEIEDKCENTLDFKKTYRSWIFAAVPCDACDEISARQKAEIMLEEALAAVRLYNIQGEIDIHDTDALVLEKDKDKAKIILRDKSRLDYIRSPKNSQRQLSILSDILEKLRQEDRDKLNAVLQYHKLSLNVKSDEARLVNLWVAVECLVRIPGTSVIDNVCSLLTPTVVTRHLQGILRNIAIDFRLAWNSPASTTLRKSSNIPESEREIPLAKLMEWLLQPDEGEEIKLIYSKLATSNPLMVFRLDRIQREYIKSADVFRNMYQSHQKHIDWQIRRIYRCRNLVVHWGRCPNSTRHLTQHLHSYLQLALINLISDLKQNPGWSIIEALEYRKKILEFLLDKKNPTLLTIQGLINPPELIVNSRGKIAGKLAWSS